jgi:transcriptional regulator with XRE-family HTH domain
VGVDQQQVADSAGVNVNTIRNMEARGSKPITSSAVTVRRVQLALEALGIEFLNHAQACGSESISELGAKVRTAKDVFITPKPSTASVIWLWNESRRISPSVTMSSPAAS